MTLVRSRAAEWHIDPHRLGVLGFSAGGHLAAVLSTQPRESKTRPDFTLLVYPAYLSVRDQGEELAPEVNPTRDNPPTFLVQTEDDHLFVGGSLLYYRALKKASVPAEMHLYANGGHGYGLRPVDAPVTHWPALAASWLQHLSSK
jgi:acetyl esterase/lipase